MPTHQNLVLLGQNARLWMPYELEWFACKKHKVMQLDAGNAEPCLGKIQDSRCHMKLEELARVLHKAK